MTKSAAQTKPAAKEKKFSVPAAIDKLPTKSAKIRALNELGRTRSEIAKDLGIRYQHVRNVLVTPLVGKK